MNRKKHPVFSVLRTMVFVVFVAFMIFVIIMNATGEPISVAGYQVLRVLSKSMEPKIPNNTCIIIKEVDPSTLVEGDIITFLSDDPNIQGYRNTHRIDKIKEENGKRIFITKGDANAVTDAYPVYEDQVKGIYVRELPGGTTLGALLKHLSNGKVYFICVMLPLFLCLLSYFWDFYFMWVNRDQDEEEEEEEE